MTPEKLAAATNCPPSRAEKWAQPITDTMERYKIDTRERQAAFLAQIAHESGRLVYVREMWSPSQCPWQAKYEGRSDLGNVQPGDGKRFMGRGLIQITGRANYRACSKGLGENFEDKPETLESPKWAALSAGWFWDSRGLNDLADKGDMLAITRRINGGTNGLDDRLALYELAKKALA